MIPPNPISQVLSTFAGLEKDLVEAQKGPMDPKMRAELVRLAGTTRACLAQLGASHQAAVEKLTSKRASVAALVAKNKQAIAAKNSKLAEVQPVADPPSKPATCLDPALGSRLAIELLSRQRPVGEPKPTRVAGLLDQWDWGTAVAANVIATADQ